MTRLYAALATVNDNRWDHMDGWGGGWMWLWGIAIMVSFVVLIVWLVRTTTAGGPGHPPQVDHTDRARGILRTVRKGRADQRGIPRTSRPAEMKTSLS